MEGWEEDDLSALSPLPMAAKSVVLWRMKSILPRLFLFCFASGLAFPSCSPPPAPEGTWLFFIFFCFLGPLLSPLDASRAASVATRLSFPPLSALFQSSITVSLFHEPFGKEESTGDEPLEEAVRARAAHPSSPCEEDGELDAE